MLQSNFSEVIVQGAGILLLNKAFKRDSQRVAFLLCVGFCDYGVMR